METSLLQMFNRQCAHLSTLSVHCQCESYLLQLAVSLFSVIMLWDICLLEGFTASLTLRSHELHISVFLASLEKKRVDRVFLKQDWMSFIRSVSLKRPRLEGPQPGEGTGSQGNSHFSCGQLCKVSSFVSHWTSEQGGGALLLLGLLVFWLSAITFYMLLCKPIIIRIVIIIIWYIIHMNNPNLEGC